MVATEQATVRGLTIAYDRAGSGPALVLLHGIGATAWRHQFDAFANDYTVIAWYAPGYGRSSDPGDDWVMADYADVLASLCDALGIERTHVLGQSWGGMLAQVFYARHPERVRSLVLSATSLGGRAQPEEERLARLNVRLRELETMTPREMARARWPAVLSPDPAPAVRDEVIEMLAQIRPVGYRRAAIVASELDTRAILPTIAVPSLVIAGEHDAVIPPVVRTRLIAEIPDAQSVTIPDAGHFAFIEQPARYNAAVQAFLHGVPA